MTDTTTTTPVQLTKVKDLPVWSATGAASDGGDGFEQGVSDYDIEYGQLKDATAVYEVYRNHGYEGSGYAVIAWPEHKYSLRSLGHCSCYGPYDDAASDARKSLDEIRAELAKGTDVYERLYFDALEQVMKVGRARQ